MLWNEPLDAVLGSLAKVRILRCLCASDAPLSGREIARRIGLSHAGVLRALRTLEESDAVWPVTDPTGIRFALNRENELVRDGLVPLFGVEASMDDRLRAYMLGQIPAALSVTMFGSVARREDRSGSDLDVLVVVPDTMDPYEVSDRFDGVETYPRLGKIVQPVVFTVSGLREAAARRLPLLDRVLEDGRLLTGEPLQALLLRGPRRAAG